MKRKLTFFIVAIFAIGCVSTKPPSPDEVQVVEESNQPDQGKRLYSIYLVGDAGEASLDPLEPSLAVLRKKLQQAGDNSAIIFLGDNAYPNGLPEKEHRQRIRTEKRLQAQFKSVENYEGQIVFVAGNHDWNSSRRGGLQAVKRQEEFVEQSLNHGNVFLPDSGMPGPEVVKVGNDHFNISIIALDTQWWLHPHTKPGAETEAEKEATKEQVIQNLRRAVTDTTVDQVLVAGHHPMYSNGIHGGKFPLKTHLLPPVVGSVYVLYRKIWGTNQDIASSDYSELRDQVTSVFAERDPLIYVSGHDHSLQHLTFDDERSNQHYLISGSSTVSSYAKTQNVPNFALQQQGFAAVHYYKKGIWVEFWNEDGKRLYEKQINT